MFTLILPTYNEKENLKVLLPKLSDLFQKNNLKYEVLVVDDDSPDRTWEWVQEYSLTNANVRVIRRVNEKGLSSAVLAGMASAKGDSLGVMDADMQHDESILPKMLDLLKEKDLVVGSRRTEEGSYGEMKWFRRFLSYGATLMAKILLPISTTDPMSGFFVLRRTLFESSKNKLNPLGFKILLEFLARNPGIRVGEVGYSFRKREFGETKLSGTVMQQYLVALIDLRFGRFISWQFIKYAITGTIGIFVNLFGQWGYIQCFGMDTNSLEGKDILLPSFAVAFGFELSVVSNFLFNNHWTFSSRKKTGFVNQLVGFFQFNGVSLFGFLIQYSSWFFLVRLFQSYCPDFFPEQVTYIANLIGIIFATVTNYNLNQSFTWAKNND
ncbi:glycosyltransferase [Leptospira idonii]|uniref:Glycosyltransferase family 2 protein n=1 Tax=Leptospira idonii TaxID=1193500 RepID=A0A4R9LY02_9LEPT|nr:glycosyltransferase family 2 protein [Leptospira idonii]TGN18315.1 glycosyltransferase family 2 protein [Leptospira idonii]